MNAQLVAPDLDWPIALDGVLMIAKEEQGPNGGPALKAYKCPAGVWTYGFGETEGVRPGMTCTETEAWQMLCRSLKSRAQAITAMLTEHATPNQLAALASLAYNIGLEGLRKSTVLKAHNRGDFAAAARAFALWNKARVNGVLVELGGLTARRAIEAALYLRPEPDAWRPPMAQAVASEPSMAASPTVQTGTVGVGAGALGLLSQAHEQLGPVGEFIAWAKGLMTDTLQIPPDWVLPGLVLGIGFVVLWRRLGQRSAGVA